MSSSESLVLGAALCSVIIACTWYSIHSQKLLGHNDDSMLLSEMLEYTLPTLQEDASHFRIGRFQFYVFGKEESVKFSEKELYDIAKQLQPRRKYFEHFRLPDEDESKTYAIEIRKLEDEKGILVGVVP